MIVAGPLGFVEAGLSKIHHQGRGHRAGRRFRDDARGAGPALRPRPQGGSRARTTASWPDLILIDGGQGQLSAVTQVLADLGIEDVPVVGVAKGPDRNAGRERFFRAGAAPLSLDAKDPVLYYLQRLRDEAHRFAIGAHRAKRAKALDRLAARRDRGRRGAAKARPPPSFRLGARGRKRRPRRSRAGRRNQQNGRKKGL